MYVTSFYRTLNTATMKKVLLCSVFAVSLLTSCSTAYKAGQTPDDLYFSPGKARTDDEQVVNNREREEYQNYISSQDDRYLRMKVANRGRWNSLDDYSYWNDSRYDFGCYNYNYFSSYYNSLNPYAWNSPFGMYNRGWGLGLSMGYGSFYNPYSYYGYGWNNPFYTVVYYNNPKAISPGSTTLSNLTAFRNKSYNNNNYGNRDPKTGAFIPASGSSFSNLVRRVFTNDGNNGSSTSSFDRAARTFTPSVPNTSSNNAPVSTSSSAGGNSGGFKSTGTSTSTGRGGRG
jgi:hypothetical protein